MITKIFLNPIWIPINFIFLQSCWTPYFEGITSTMANTHLAYPDLAIDKFSGTDPDQDVESFIELIYRKINSALGDAAGDAGELANYYFRKKELFSSLLRGPAADWYENNITNATTWENVRTIFITRFQMDETNFDTQWKCNIVLEEMEKNFGTSYIASRQLWIKGGQTIWKEWPHQTMVLKELLRHDKEDKDTSTIQWRDLDLDSYNAKHKRFWWKSPTPHGTTFLPE